MVLRIFEIFYSIQGETSRTGLPTVFIRLSGCPMRCAYCDTDYAFSGGKNLSIEAILAEVEKLGGHYVTVTGGEPLAQKESLKLLNALCDAGYNVSLETGGAMDIQHVDQRVSVILDIKTPASTESENNCWTNLEYIKSKDEIKFVICNQDDYEWTKEKMKSLALVEKCPIIFSPSYKELDATELANWVLEDKLPVRMQVQLHKVLWGEKQGV